MRLPDPLAAAIDRAASVASEASAIETDTCAPFAKCTARFAVHREHASTAAIDEAPLTLLSHRRQAFGEASGSTKARRDWAADGRMKVATFGPTPARYVRFEVLAANGSPAVTEITVGARR
jgi:hypothetical protein